MANKQISVILNLKDKMSQPLVKVSGNVEKVTREMKKSQNQIRKLCLQEAEQSTDLVGIDTKRIQRKDARTQIYWTRAEYNQSNSLKIQKHNRSNPFYQDFTRYYKWFVKWFFNYICGVSLDPRIAKQHSMHLYIMLETMAQKIIHTGWIS